MAYWYGWLYGANNWGIKAIRALTFRNKEKIYLNYQIDLMLVRVIQGSRLKLMLKGLMLKYLLIYSGLLYLML